MKKMLTAALAALALVGATQQQASAWCRFNFSTGLNISYESSGGTSSFLGFTRTSDPMPCGAPVGVPAYGAYPAPGLPPYAAAPTASPAAAGNPSVRQAAYFTHYYQQGYAPQYNAAAPSYWFGE